MQFCSNCGWNNADTAAACKCGKPLKPVVRPQARVGAVPSTTAPSSSRGFGANPAIKVVLGIVMLIAGLALFLIGAQTLGAVASLLSGASVLFTGLKGMRSQPQAFHAGALAGSEETPWKTPWKAFYSSSFYGAVARRARGSGALYLVALEAGLWLISAFLAYGALKSSPGTSLDEIVAKVPNVRIRDGKAQVDAEQPYYLRFQDGSRPTSFVFDTTGEITAIDNRPDISALLTVNKVHTRGSNGQIRIYDLSGTKSFDVTAEILRGWISRFKIPVLVLIYLGCVAGAFIYRFIQAAIYAGIALLVANASKKTLTFGEGFRLAIAAMTPMILVDSALGWLGVSLASGLLWWVACLGITLGFLVFAVRSADTPSS